VTPEKKKKKNTKKTNENRGRKRERERRVVERTWSTKKREKNNLS